jgi:IS4 transposase
MVLSKLFERFVEQAPMSVIARAAMEHAMAPGALDGLFVQHAQSQYPKELLFSSVVDIMGVVVCKVYPSVHAAYQACAKSFPVTVTALYDKLNGTEPAVASALVAHTAERLAPLVVSMGGEMSALLPGYRVRIIDGNHLAATERRLAVLRGSVAGPLPGHALVILDPQRMLATQMIPCEDGHAQERSLSGEILECVEADDVWVADRNFCTTPLLFGIESKSAFFVIRQHANIPITSKGKLRRCGRTETGEVFEQSVTIKDAAGQLIHARRIVLRLDKPTRDGDAELAVLTNLPKSVTAVAIAELYRKRWTLETLFQSLTQMFEGEIDTLGYPRAALLGFAVALAAYNVLSTVQAALRGAFGAETVQEEVSGYYIANEIRATATGLSIALGDDVWRPFQSMPAKILAKQMLTWAKGVHLPRYQRHPRGPKKPVPKRTRYAKETHVSTARLLAKALENRP